MAERFARLPAWAASCRELTARDWRVLAAICLHVDAEGNAHPSMGRIAAITGITRSHVADLISRLERFGFLRRHRRQREGTGWDRNEYRVSYADVFPQTGTGVPEYGNRGVPGNGYRGVPVDGTLNYPREQPKDSYARQAERECAAETATLNTVFETFWRCYPSRKPQPNPRKPARAKFEAAVKRGVDPRDMIRGARVYRAIIEQERTDPKYVVQAVRWLNEERWTEYQQEPEPPRLAVGMV